MDSQVPQGLRRRVCLRLAGLALLVSVLTVGTSAQGATCADATRTEFLSSSAAACRVYDANQAACETAWALTRQGGEAVSCFFRPAGTVSSTSRCEGCGPANQTANACVNACLAAPTANVPATSVSTLLALGVALAWVGRRGTRPVANK